MRISDKTIEKLTDIVIIISLIGVGVMFGFILYFKATIGI